MDVSQKNGALTDLVGFWMLVFCGFGLVMITFAESKIDRRFERLEARRSYLKPSPAPKAKDDRFATDSSPSTAHLPRYSLLPIRLLLGAGTIGGAMMVIRWSCKRLSNTRQ